MLGLSLGTDQIYGADEGSAAPAPFKANQEAQGQEERSGHSSEESLLSHIPFDIAAEQPGSAPPHDESGRPGTLSHGRPEADPAAQSAITGFQALVRGQQARSHVNVSAVEDTGIVHVQIKGDADTFKRVGIENLDRSTGPKELHYLRVPSEGFQGRAVGGDSIYYDKEKAAECGTDSQQSLVSNTLPEAKSHAYINGGYFNLNEATEHAAKHTPIGETATSGGKSMPSLPVPRGYAEDYTTLTLHDRSKITSGPVLSEDGQEKFPKEKLNDPKYQYQGRNRAEPGVLKHAQQPNPRSGVSLPGANSPEDASRLAVGLTRGQRGSRSPGFTMPEWSTVMARLDRLNQTPGGSVNLDGGGSSALGVVNSEGEKLVDERENKTRGASTLIVYSSGPGTTPPRRRRW
jgi:insecticidal toxin complex protein TccC